MASPTVKAVFNSLLAGETVEIVFSSLEQKEDFGIELSKFKKKQEDIMIACMLMDLEDVKQVYFEKMASSSPVEFWRYRVMLQKKNRFLDVKFIIVKKPEAEKKKEDE